VNICDAAPCGLIDLAAVVLDPGEVTQVFFTLDRHDCHFAGVFSVRIGANFEHDLFAGRLFKKL